MFRIVISGDDNSGGCVVKTAKLPDQFYTADPGNIDIEDQKIILFGIKHLLCFL